VFNFSDASVQSEATYSCFSENPYVGYDYEFRLYIVNGNPGKPASWTDGIMIDINTTNEDALCFLTRHLIEQQFPADQRLRWSDWDEEYGKYDDDEDETAA